MPDRGRHDWAIYLQACGNTDNTNPSQLWTVGVWGQLINDHSQDKSITYGEGWYESPAQS